jgi:hypothetical protein
MPSPHPASFAELSLQLMALGAPTALVRRCHGAGLDEIAHATVLDRLSGAERTGFGPIPYLLGRSIGGQLSTRRRRLARIALESYKDGWLNEGASAAEMEARGRSAATPEERRAFERIAGDERGHADLGRDVVLWCFGEEPRGVGRALAGRRAAAQNSRGRAQLRLPRPSGLRPVGENPPILVAESMTSVVW